MRKVFLDNLPRLKRNKGEKINWRKSIGYTVDFEYDNIKGTIFIVDYHKYIENDKNSWKLKVRYLDGEYLINAYNFSSANLSIILGLMREDNSYIYNISEIINAHTSQIIILNQIRIKVNRKINKRQDNETHKGYEYRCLKCGNIDTMSEQQIKGGGGCNVCSGDKILIGYNDLWTTHPKIAKLLEDPNDGYAHTYGTHKKLNFICPDCKTINKNKILLNYIRRGFSCSYCSDGHSYPNKFSYALLEQLNDIYKFNYLKHEYSPEWIKPKRFDNYFEYENYKYILEMDGAFHKKDNNMSGQTINESKAIDDFKDMKAKEHNIEVIRIDCENPSLEFIKNNILNSKLNHMFDLSLINWFKIEEFALSNLVKIVSNYWSNDIKSTKEIANIIKLDRSTIRRYLKQGAELDWCDYDPIKEKQKVYDINSEKMCKQVICLTTGEIFNSIKEASKKYNFKYGSNISACCNGRHKSAGEHPITGVKMVWMFYDNYILKNNKEIEDILNNVLSNKKNKKVICITTNEIFNSISEASVKYDMRRDGSHISECCKGKIKSAGKLRDGTKLVWKYYDEYIVSNNYKGDELK